MQALKGIGQSCGLDGLPESALHWIGSLKGNYIMVFDNADDLSPAELEAYLPPGRGGNILIASRSSAMKTLTSPENSLEVAEMEENDAIELLLKASCLDSSSMNFQAEASKIVRELFCFPLAIDQAGAYIASGATTIGDYLGEYSKHRKTLLSHSAFTGASKYNRNVYDTWELSYKRIQQTAKSEYPHRANAANSAILLLELIPFFHHEQITEDIFYYSALQKDNKTPMLNLPLASSLLDPRLLPLHQTGTWDNFNFQEGIRILQSVSLIRRCSSDNVYAMHPLAHSWGRDRLTLNEKKKCCLMAYVTLACSLRWDAGQSYGFQRTLVTHVRANMEYFKSEVNESTVCYLDDAYENFGRLLREQGYPKEAETLQIQVLDRRNRILGVEHPDTINAMGNLAETYGSLGNYREAEKLEIQVLHARNRILGEEHPDTIRAMANLGATYQYVGNYTKAEKLEIQVLDTRTRILGVEHPDTLMAMENLAKTYDHMGKHTDAEKLQAQVADSRIKIKAQFLDRRIKKIGPKYPGMNMAIPNLSATYDHPRRYTVEAKQIDKIQVLDDNKRTLEVEYPDDEANNLATKVLQGTVANKLQVQVWDAGKEIVETEHPLITGASINLAPNGKQLVLVAKTALQHLQKCEAEIKVALSLSGISEMDYILLAGFNESVIHSGIGYLEEIHVILKSEFPSNDGLLSSLGRIFSPFPGMIFTTCPPYSFKTPVFNNEGKAQKWDEVVFTQAHTYTTLRMGNKMKEMALMSANICPNEGNISSGSGSGGDGDENEQEKGENVAQGSVIDNDPQRGGKKDSEEDDNDSEGDDPDNPDSEGSSNTDLPISFTIQTEIYPKIPPVLASGPSSSKPSKPFQLIQLEGSITVQVCFSSKHIHKKIIILFQTKSPQLKPRQLASSCIEFKEFKLQSIADVDSTFYHLTHFRAEINTREELTKFKNIKPASTRAVDSETKVIEENKQTLAATLGSTLGISSLKPTGLFSISGTKTKESSSTKELKVFNSRIIQKNYNGAIWWEFLVDDPNQQQQGLDLQELGTLPCVSCTFVGSSDDASPPSAADLFGVEVMSCWSLIP